MNLPVKKLSYLATTTAKHCMYFVDNILLKHVGLPHVLVFAIHLVNLAVWVKGNILRLFYY